LPNLAIDDGISLRKRDLPKVEKLRKYSSVPRGGQPRESVKSDKLASLYEDATPNLPRKNLLNKDL
jgi:hypothetical protein